MALLKGRIKTSRIHLQLPVHESEHLCGLPPRVTRNSAVSLRGFTALFLAASPEQSHGSRGPEVASVSTGTLAKPCQSDCGAGTFSSSNQSRPRDTGATSYADKPRPPSAALLEHSPFSPPNTLDALCRCSRPR